MRLVKVPRAGLMEAETQRIKRQLKLSWEDLILALALIVIITSWLKGIFTPEQVLAYLGFTATGGIWGYVSGSKSK
ncbi:MAG: hypothetical protein HWN66_18970 [Candidatus Helarchaeota archaeon]|nr:hypothetical protein [Candidatus Helarchaeota archaeon]